MTATGLTPPPAPAPPPDSPPSFPLPPPAPNPNPKPATGMMILLSIRDQFVKLINSQFQQIFSNH